MAALTDIQQISELTVSNSDVANASKERELSDYCNPKSGVSENLGNVLAT